MGKEAEQAIRVPPAENDTPELAQTRALVSRFYDSYAALNIEGMVACMHPEITFSDPVYPNLRKSQVPAMWLMHVQSVTRHREAFKLSYEFVFLEERKAQVHWQASYLYAGKRKVHHKVLSTLTFWDDQIVRLVDGYPFYPWSKQALGISGLALGWHSKYRATVQKAAAKQLSIFMTA